MIMNGPEPPGGQELVQRGTDPETGRRLAANAAGGKPPTGPDVHT
jgi:hypothetical protein